ncbi:MAG: 16S rRNA (cytidine(1402)-2'-O)-methyltransferase [Clostridia bacterium]|nr:16S rRNA (cytidine(1402)-2'-O)-methyltransferase [Clostridia bacterium]
MPRLFVVATPIGNLQDLSPRALETLRTVGFIAAEDTRVTMKLCQVFSIHTQLVSCHMHNEESKGRELAERMLRDNVDAALVTDAGTPCVSDPGHLFVRACTDLGIEVLPVPGPVAGASALSVSGFDCREWKFYGFLPREKKDLRDKLLSMPGETPVAIVHESPYRVLELMEAICEVLPEAQVSVSCDLTKLHELTLRGTAAEVLASMRENPKTEKGEYCLVLELRGCVHKEEASETSPQDMPLELKLLQLMLSGVTLRDAQAKLVEAGEKKNAVKAAALSIKKGLWEADVW